MNTYSKLSIIVLLALLMVIGLPANQISGQRPSPDDWLLDAAAQISGRPRHVLELATIGKAESVSGEVFHTAKIFDKETNGFFEVAVDAQGNPIDLKSVYSAVHNAYKNRYGKLDPALFKLLQEAAPGDLLHINITLKVLNTLDVERPMFALEGKSEKSEEYLSSSDEETTAEEVQSLEQFEAIRVERIAAYQAEVERLEESLVEWLRDNGVTITYLSKAYPMVGALIPAMMMASISDREDVESISLVRQASDTINTVRGAVRAGVVWSRGNIGSGIGVGIAEWGNIGSGGQNRGLVAQNNPYLSSQIKLNWVPDGCSTQLNPHGTKVAGIIGANKISDPTYRGMAYQAELWYESACNQGWPVLQEIWNDLSYTRYVHIINNSWGEDSDRIVTDWDRLADSYFRNYMTFMVMGAGNEGPKDNFFGIFCADDNDDDILTPALGYNVMTVGNFNHSRDSILWNDNMINTCSSAGDPRSFHGDREKPEVAAPGYELCVPNTGNGITCSVLNSGTSLSAPVVSAQAALISKRNIKFYYWPEVIKAIIMASATNRVGQSYAGANGQGSRLSEKAGAGGVMFNNADNIAQNTGRWKYDYLTSDSFDQYDNYFGKYYKTWWLINAVQGKKYRVVIVWDTDPARTAYNTTESQPSSDLDLVIMHSGKRVAYSMSYDNTYEIVEFWAPASGTYGIRVLNWRWDEADGTWFGLALHVP